MKIATHNSEKLLLADLREARIGNPKHRCLLLRLSQVEEDISIWLPALERSMRHSMLGVTEQVYLTHDQDIFIYGWGLTQTLCQDLAYELSDTLSRKSMQNLMQLYEIGMHWNQLESLCVAKIRALEEKNNKKGKVTQTNTMSREDMFSHLDLTLIETLENRRLKRKEINILVVEDDIFSQTLVKKALGDEFRISVVGDGKGAVLSYLKSAPDICFLDIELPDINGHEVLQKLKTIDPHAYIIMFSGNGDRENILKAIDLGSQGFVGKPFTKEKLFQYIDKSPFIAQKRKKTKDQIKETV